MHFGKARTPTNKRMDIGRPSLQKRPDTYEIMDIPNPSFEKTSPTTEVSSHITFRTDSSIPENIRIVKCSLENQDPEKLNSWISGDRIWKTTRSMEIRGNPESASRKYLPSTEVYWRPQALFWNTRTLFWNSKASFWSPLECFGAHPRCPGT